MRLQQNFLCAALILAGLAAPAAAQTAPAASPPPRPFAGEPPRNWQRFPEADEIQLRDVVGLVRVIPEARRDVAVAVRNAGPLPAPQFRISRERLIVNGQLRGQVRGCHAIGADGLEVRTGRFGNITDAALPVYEIRVPRHAVVLANGAMRLRMGASESAELRFDGCGDADIERVSGEADVTTSGAPDVRVYDAGSATVAMAGAGDVGFGLVRNGLTLSIAGAGNFSAARVDGETSVAIQGSGDVDIRDGVSNTLSVAIAGSGDVIHNGEIGRLDAVILGAGDVRVRHVNGEVTRRVLGSGEVVVGR